MRYSHWLDSRNGNKQYKLSRSQIDVYYSWCFSTRKIPRQYDISRDLLFGRYFNCYYPLYFLTNSAFTISFDYICQHNKISEPLKTAMYLFHMRRTNHLYLLAEQRRLSCHYPDKKCILFSLWIRRMTCWYLLNTCPHQPVLYCRPCRSSRILKIASVPGARNLARIWELHPR